MATDYLLSWIGGKRLLRKVIAPMVPTDIGRYVEPFGGAAWILFFKERWAESEVYNDLDSRLVNLFRCVKHHPDEMRRELQLILHSREMFDAARDCVHATDIQRAAAFFYLIQRSFGAQGENFAASKTDSVLSFPERIAPISRRLAKVNIEHMDFERLIDCYDAPNAFFYCDPPYSAGAGYETTSTAGFDHERLLSVLGRVKGRWLLSYDDAPKINDLYARYTIEKVSRAKGINGKAADKVYREVLIKNY